MTDSSAVSPVPMDSEPAEASQHKRWPRWLVPVVAGGVAVVLVAAGLTSGWVLGVWGDDEPAASPEPSPTPTATEPMDPFAGTPAEDFAEGEAGIVMPEAEAIGEFTADEVAEALEQVRDALIAARLDPAVIVNHDLEPFLALLAPDQQVAVQAAIEAHGYGPFPTLVAPDAAFAAVPPRVQGNVSYEVTTAGARDTPVLGVTTRFVWVYAFEAAVVVVGDELVWEIAVGRPWGESSQGLWLSDGTAHAWGLDCDAYPETLRPSSGAADLTDAAIFDPERPLEAAPAC